MQVELVAFSTALQRAVDEHGFLAAILFDRNGETIGIAGDIDRLDAPRLAAYVMHRFKSDDLSERLFAGEVLSLRIDERDIAISLAVAKRQLFLLVILPSATLAALTGVRDLLQVVEEMIPANNKPFPFVPLGGSGGSGSGPAELPLIELGITVGRPRAKA